MLFRSTNDTALVERVRVSDTPKSFLVRPAMIRNFLDIFDVYEGDEALLLGATSYISDEELDLQKFASALQHSKVAKREYGTRKPTLYRAKITRLQCVAASNFMEDENTMRIFRIEDHEKYYVARQFAGNLLQQYENAPVATNAIDSIKKRFGIGK